MYHKYDYQTADPFLYSTLKEKAKYHRNNPTEAEALMWYHLRELEDYTFKRQHIIDQYIADFVCLEEKLIVEIDGEYHNTHEQVLHDQQRTERLNDLGYSVIRYTNEEVFSNVENVVERIKAHIELMKI